jgi:hypothetical protein
MTKHPIGFAALAIACAAYACSPKQAEQAPRQSARAVVLAVAEAARVADKLCADIALKAAAVGKREGAEALASTCADAYDVARPAIVAAAEGVDAWESGERLGVVCGLARASSALLTIVGAIKAAGASVPPVVEDGLRLAGVLGACHEPA